MYEVTARFALPNLAPLLPPGGRVHTTQQQREKSCFDTAERDLRAADIALTRRDRDEQTVRWRLELRGKVLREISAVPGTRPDVVPDELAELVAGAARGRGLHRVATIATDEVITGLQTKDGRTLVTLLDRSRTASISDGQAATISTRRTVRVRPEGSGGKNLARAVRAKMASGGQVGKVRNDNDGSSRVRSGVGAGYRVTTGHGVNAGNGVNGGKASAALFDYLQAQDRELIAGDLSLRLGEGGIGPIGDVESVGGVHSTRVAVRRFRSTLRTFRRFFDDGPTAHLDAELAWYAGLLGQVRDHEVQLARLGEELDQVPDELQLGPVRADVVQHLTSELIANHRRLRDALESRRYFDLLAATRQFAGGAGLATAANQSRALTHRGLTGRAVADTVRSRSTKVDRKLAAAALSQDPDAALHSARKAAKRARYAVELDREHVGRKKAHRLIKRLSRLQDLLGEHQDAVVTMDLMRRWGSAAASDAGRNGFTYGLIFQRQAQKADAVVRVLSKR